MGWLPIVTVSELIFPTLVRVFYLMATYGIGGLIISTIRAVEICLDSESIYRIFDIDLVGLRVYEFKIWPTMPGFKPREVVQRICGLANTQGMDKPSTHSLTVINRVLHHMISLSCYHETNIETRSPIMRHFSWILFWWGNRSTWGTWWWCTWSYVVRAWPEYSPMATPSPKCSRMSGLIWAERQILRPPTVMTRMMICRWGWWNLRRPMMVLGLDE